MGEVAVAIPGDLATPTGGYVYARRLIAALPAEGWTPRLLSLPDGFPFPDARAFAETDAALAKLAEGMIVLVDGLAFGALPAKLLRAHSLTYVALVHHPLAAETGLSPETAAALARSERLALAHAARVIATSQHTARRLAADYGVPSDRLAVARPGVDPAPCAEGSGSHGPLLLTVATLTPRKGHLALVAALDGLRDLPWRAVFAGSTARHPATTAAVRQAIDAAGLQERIILSGAVDGDDLDALYATADLFVLPSVYEGYGMAFAEALVCGLPVIGCAVGAVPETVPADAGILVPPDDPAELAKAIGRVLADRGLRAAMAAAARRAGLALPRWSDTAREIAAVLNNLKISSARSNRVAG